MRQRQILHIRRDVEKRYRCERELWAEPTGDLKTKLRVSPPTPDFKEERHYVLLCFLVTLVLNLKTLQSAGSKNEEQENEQVCEQDGSVMDAAPQL